MPLWGSNTAANTAAPKIVPFRSHKANTNMNQTLFSNTTVGAFVNGAIKDAIGANSTQTPFNGSHRGWQIKTTGTGPLLTAAIQAGSNGYDNADILAITSPANSLNGGVNASATLTTNSTGGITGFAFTVLGKGFINATPTYAVTNSTGGTANGTGANVVFTVGGRAGRVHVETIVAAGSFTS